ncbi:chromosome segregation protein SMC [Thioclava sp. GXIMD2076]|uniref:chromosome segregation protein SMC n=1 Tax=Thioclava sp. GXIMD2076 TaxID=3131931 RepID=UPI0030CD5320
MRFTRLRLNGFKSFVDPTDLVIQDGLTGVVGPNGCGKSNLLEALRWVMGEHRASAMRGGGMEDVIFAGTSTRGARNFAEVVLQIDNEERLAPSGFNDSDLLEITRRITRDVGSAYKVNTKDVRARDVQMLFADASTGAHSPALVRQGQINELINAKPKARRRILEEAAGISGLYQRRHEAELRLKATEANLERIDDVIDQLAGQLNSLARQARQAAKYRQIGEELRRSEGMLLYRRWLEADETRQEAEKALSAIIANAGVAERAARDSAELRANLEEILPPMREEDTVATAILQRLVLSQDQLSQQEAQARGQIETLKGRIAQIDRDMERETSLNRDAGETLERLEYELRQIARDSAGHEEALAAAEEAAQEAAEIARDREEILDQLTGDVAQLAARHQSAERQLADSQASAERFDRAAATARLNATEAEEALAEVNSRIEAAQEAASEATEMTDQAEEALHSADDLRGTLETREAEAREARAEAEGEMSALKSEVSALTRLLDRDAMSGPQILDRISVSKGYEAALGAALADDLNAPEAAGNAGSGWLTLPDYSDAPALPAGLQALARYVQAPEALTRRLNQIGVVESWDQGDALHKDLRPGQRIVTLAGDLWRWDGLRAGAEDAPSAAAQRLRQQNRLSDLRADLAVAEASTQSAVRNHEQLKQKLADANLAYARARDTRREADKRLAEAQRLMSKAEADRSVTEGRLEAARQAEGRHAEEARAARATLEEAQSAINALPALSRAREEMDQVKITVEAARMTMLTRRSAQDEVRREGEARTRRHTEITEQLGGWKTRLATAERHGAELAERRAEALEELEEAMALPEELNERRDELREQIQEAEARKSKATTALQDAESRLRTAQTVERETEKQASEIREARARAETRVESAREALTLAVDWISDEMDLAPESLLKSLDIAPGDMPTIAKLEKAVADLKRDRDALGAVNLRAEEDARSIQEEHDTLFTEKGDLEDAIAKLRGGINGLNREGRERLLAAFEQVNQNFRQLFTHLFSGGDARLALVESDDPLEAGLEIMCQPPGKKLSTLSLLSGGEQTLTAMALIFAVFMANPAPICVLDEVDAPLDDANVTRFCDLLDEMTRRTETRFLIITHHAVTMSRMDRLFGVTMQEQGVSQLVSVDLKKAEAMVA